MVPKSELGKRASGTRLHPPLVQKPSYRSSMQSPPWYALPLSVKRLQYSNTVFLTHPQHLIRSDNFQSNPVAAVFLDSNSIQVDFNGADIISSSRYILRLTENFTTNDTIRAGMPVRRN